MSRPTRVPEKPWAAWQALALSYLRSRVDGATTRQVEEHLGLSRDEAYTVLCRLRDAGRLILVRRDLTRPGLWQPTPFQRVKP